MLIHEKPSRKAIIKLYDSLKENDQRSNFYIAKEICIELGYSIDKNGSNSYVLRVIREYDKHLL